jgi:hypothetical protein
VKTSSAIRRIARSVFDRTVRAINQNRTALAD